MLVYILIAITMNDDFFTLQLFPRYQCTKAIVADKTDQLAEWHIHFFQF